MKGRAFLLASFCLLLVATALIQSQKPLSKGHVLKREVPLAAQQRVVETYGKLPLRFEANQGQTDPQVKFLSRRRNQGVIPSAARNLLFNHRKEICRG